jgi:hypothetical protein
MVKIASVHVGLALQRNRYFFGGFIGRIILRSRLTATASRGAGQKEQKNKDQSPKGKFVFHTDKPSIYSSNIKHSII